MDRILIVLTVLFTLACVVFAPGVYAADVTLAWDANSETDLAGYRLYYDKDGTGAPYEGDDITEGVSPISIPLSDLSDQQNPQYTVTGLTSGTYWFTVTAYDEPGNESGYSNEASAICDTSPPSNPSGLNVVVVVNVTIN